MELYPYQPLDPEIQEIRVLDVLPGPPQSLDVSATVRHISLQDTPMPQYETVSYCWGDATIRGTMVLDNICIDCPLSSVTALRYLRHADRPRTLWIDALCINQSDIKERSSQVALMAQIFTRTLRTLVWLGEADQRTSGAFEQVDAQLALIKAQIRDDEYLEEVFNQHDRGFVPTNGDGTVADSVKTAVELFKLPWWTRLWVVQEVTLAPESDCYLGTEVRGFVNILRAGMWLFHKYNLLSHMPDAALRYHRYVIWTLSLFCDPGYTRNTQKRDNMGFRVILELTNGRETADKRDRIYGILGLSSQTWNGHHIADLLKPDYTKSVLEVYQDATMLKFRQDKGFQTLNFTHLTTQTSQEEVDYTWPSWVRRWDQPFYNQRWTHGMLFRFSAGGRNLPENFDIVAACGRNHILSVPGIAIQPVLRTTRAWMGTDDHEQSIHPWIEQCANVAASVLSRENNAVDPVAGVTRVLELLAASRRRPHDDAHSTPEEKLSLIDKACHLQRFFVTEQYMGLCPAATEVDDVVYILLSVNLPLMLRRWDGDWRIVGSCFVHGLLHGEAMKDIDINNSGRIQTIRLR